jgi:hypothetical protein
LLAQDADHAHRGGIRGGIRHLLGTDRLSPDVSALLDPDQKKRALEMGTFQQFMLGGEQGVANNMIGLAKKRKEMDTAARQESDFRRIRDTAAKMPMGPERSEYVARAMAEVIDNPVNAMQTAVGLREREFAPQRVTWGPTPMMVDGKPMTVMKSNDGQLIAPDGTDLRATGARLEPMPPQAPPNQILPSINPDGTPGYTAVSGRGGEVKVTPVEDVVRPDASGRTTAAVRAKVASNRTQLLAIDTALNELKKHPDAIGLVRGLGDDVNQRADPEGVLARAAIANVGSLKIHDRTGAVMSAREQPRLVPFIPGIRDRADAAKVKLEELRRQIETETAELERSAPAGEKPPLADRISALRAEGKSKEEAKAILLREGYRF